MKRRICALAAALAVGIVPAARISAQPRTTAPPPVETIKVTITDAAIRMAPKRAQRGTFGRFILVNVGSKPHAFTLGNQRQRHGAGSQTGFTKALGPGAQAILLLFLDYRGKIPYAGSLPPDRSKPGMKGNFTIF